MINLFEISWRCVFLSFIPIFLARATLLPDQDPFYKAPANTLQSTKLGSIIRYRPVPNPITIDNQKAIYPKAAWQLLYRTQNSVGEPEATVVTVLIPEKAKSNNLFSFQYFSDAAYNGCNPSINVQLGARNDSQFTQAQMMIAVEALSQGWYVSIADDGGVQASFAANLHAGYATLDSIRAVLQSGNITGISPKAIVGTYGYSGGGVVGAFTTELQPTYAPELNISGTVVGGLIPSMINALKLYNKNDRASYIPAAILGISHDYKNLSQWLSENLVPSLEPEFRKAESQCFTSNAMYSYQDLGKYFKRGYDSLFEQIPMSAIEPSGILGVHSTPKTPWYLYETAWDDVSPINATDALALKYCQNGANILYERNSIVKLNHSMESMYGLPGSFTWLQDRFAGKPIQTGCRVFNMTHESITGWTQGKIFRGLFDDLLAYLGLPISGPARARVLESWASTNEQTS